MSVQPLRRTSNGNFVSDLMQPRIQVPNLSEEFPLASPNGLRTLNRSSTDRSGPVLERQCRLKEFLRRPQTVIDHGSEYARLDHYHYLLPRLLRYRGRSLFTMAHQEGRASGASDHSKSTEMVIRVRAWGLEVQSSRRNTSRLSTPINSLTYISWIGSWPS